MRIRSRKNVRHALIALAAGILVAVGLAPSAAHAAEPNHTWAWWKNPAHVNNGGVAETRSYGENLVVEDFRADGWGTRAQLQVLTWDPAGYQYWKNHGGVCFDDTSTGNSSGGRTVCDRNVAEGATFRVHIWASQSGTYKWHEYSPSIKA
ncbi:hypothetical protein K3N28_02055 [Glycomyces sp. TRM65418]|uniref:hypothetical protein n=1 Tax=Glycomyces sp. TRM65418 TaxID=2867006 RepID=UPI001CE4C9DB|nr:hypothetical protein [Glycomyces sp. TRM65418]MCC3761857.1 hypothetical protein [Glycomyces sp. TRM65418]QZD55938.1 hypothetical protein K3N28_02045 [Glycomyces sp. TRM65418]